MNNSQSSRRTLQFFILTLSTLFSFGLLFGRWQYLPFDWTQIDSFAVLKSYRGAPTFLFLVWNLFLAWIPYWIALSIDGVFEKTKSKILSVTLLGLWLLFFPNAPYIITDLLHLKSRFPVPHWYDMMLIFSFAWTGLALGLLSLYEVQLFLEKHFKANWAWLFSTTSIALAGFGIFIGRFQRWNSWDVFTQPKEFGYAMARTVSNPAADGNAIDIALVISGFMLIGYLFLVSMRKH